MHKRGLVLLTGIFLLIACAPAPAVLPTGTFPPPLPTFTETFTPSALPPTPIPATITPLPYSPICSPLENHDNSDLAAVITAYFELPTPPGSDVGHHGVDFGTDRRGEQDVPILGTSIYSVLDGVVASELPNRNPYGNTIIIETPYSKIPLLALAQADVPDGYSLYTLYAHMQEPAPFAIGEPIRCGETLGLVGATGWLTGPHLHLEMRFGPPGQTFTAMARYTDHITDAEIETYKRWRMSGEFFLFNPMLLFP